MRAADYQNQQFRLWVKRETVEDGVRTYHLHILDKFSRARHRPERAVFALFVHQIEKQLVRRPHVKFDHPKNLARSLIYLPPGIRAWAQYMPGGFATYPVHNPDLKRLHDGKRIGYLTRNLFRHSKDGIGLRSRAYAMSWYVAQYVGKKKRVLQWLSVAAGTGQPTFDAAMHLPKFPTVILADIDSETLEFARGLAAMRGIGKSVTTAHVDVAKRGAFAKLLRSSRPDVIDMMGLMEYLDDTTVTALVKTFYQEAPHGSLLVFTNMRPTHPELETHKRGLGWPGVIVRTTGVVLELIDNAGVGRDMVELLLPDDDVYALYCVKKP